MAFDNLGIRLGEQAVFAGTNWTWRLGEQWAFLGPDDSGKSLLVQAILDRAPIIHGEVRGPVPAQDDTAPRRPTAAWVSPQAQRDLAVQESSFYQLRWHSGLEQGPRTVAEFLSQDSVEARNPFEVGAPRGDRRKFLRRRRQIADLLGITGLFRRKLLHLSNGEMRKALLAHALLASPYLLVLEDPYAGLDAATRRKLSQVIANLMREGWPVLVATSRAEEIPMTTTHLLLVRNHRVIAQGPRREMLAHWRRFTPGEKTAPQTDRNRHHKRDNRQKASLREPLLELKHVTVQGAGRTILRDIDWALREGERWVLLGPNGAGKSTLLNLIQGDHPQAYALDIRLFGKRTDSTQNVWRARERIGWMSPELHQHYPAGWEGEDVVCSGFFNSIGLHQSPTRRQRAAARRWLARVGLGEHARTAFGELPFGRQRLVLLARAVVKRPRLLILDEPCQGLDASQRRKLLDAVDRAVAETGASLIFVTHHQHEIPRCITNTLRLKSGRVRRAGALRVAQ